MGICDRAVSVLVQPARLVKTILGRAHHAIYPHYFRKRKGQRDHIDGVELKRLHSFSVDYIEGAPLLSSCVADVGTGTKEETRLLN